MTTQVFVKNLQPGGGNGVTTPDTGYFSISIGQWMIVIALFAILSGLTPNPLITFSSAILIPVLLVLLWRTGEPPVLFFAVSVQWLQVTISVFWSDYLGKTIPEYFSSWTGDDAIYSCLVGVLVLAVGVRTALIGMPKPSRESFHRTIMKISLHRLWIAYFSCLVMSFVVSEFLWQVPRLTQLLIALKSVKWIFYLVICVCVLYKKEGWRFLIIPTIIELVIGFAGFFSVYKKVFFVLLVTYLGVNPTISKATILKSILIIATVVYLSIIWTSVKMEYRDFLNQGTGQQVVRVPFAERIEKIFGLYTDIRQPEISVGIEKLISRISYVTYYSMVLIRVPDILPHTDGALWGRAVEHVLYPRLFFPNKPGLAIDTELTEKYTGIDLIRPGGRDTNVPMGYMTESYIDFGPKLMYAPLFIIGLLWGLIYRLFMRKSDYILFRYGIVVAVILQAASLEIATTKLLGGMITNAILMWLVFVLLIPSVASFVNVVDQRRRRE